MENLLIQNPTIVQFGVVLLLALIFWGVPSFLYGKYKIMYIDYPVAHTVWHGIGIIVMFLFFKTKFLEYFSGTSLVHLIVVVLITVIWMFIPILYRKFGREHLTIRERIAYQPAKYSEIALQQVVVLGILLTLDWKLLTFGLVFFGIHAIAGLFLPEKAFWATAPASLLGGFAFAILQSFGVIGFISSLALHLAFYIILQSGVIPKFEPYKR